MQTLPVTDAISSVGTALASGIQDLDNHIDSSDQLYGRWVFLAAYLYASLIERLHPMNCGFWTLRRRTDRRSVFPREAFLPYWWGWLNFTLTRLTGIVHLFLQLEEVWLRSRPKSKTEEALQELMTVTRQEIIDWRDLRVKDLAALYGRLQEEMPEVRVPSALILWFRKHNPFAGAFTRASAQSVWRRWYLHVWNPLKLIELWIFEFVNAARFLKHLLVEGR